MNQRRKSGRNTVESEIIKPNAGDAEVQRNSKVYPNQVTQRVHQAKTATRQSQPL